MRTKAQLEDALHELGVPAGKPLMVHAGLRKLGPVEGGADAVLDALEAVVGPAGTLLMALGADPDEPFDARDTEVDVEDMGILAEVFRQRATVNDHAAARFGARGPEAPALLEPIPLHDYHGPGSVLDRLVARGGSVLRLGADDDTITLTHLAEYLADVPNKRRVRLRYVRADIGEQWIESLDDTHGIVDGPDGIDDYFPQIWIDYRDAGLARTGPVGDCTGELFDAADFLAWAVRWLETRL